MLELAVPGKNVLALEVHNQNIGSSDALLQVAVSATFTPRPTSHFVRGANCDDHPTLNISDPIRLLRWRFLGAALPACPKACDINDDGQIETSDAIHALQYLFLEGPPPAPPFPIPGEDPTEDELKCGED